MINIFLHHRDLRIHDNTALINQNKNEDNIIPIFIFPPEQINKSKNDYFSNNSVQFMIESLHELSDEVKEKKGKIYFFCASNPHNRIWRSYKASSSFGISLILTARQHPCALWNFCF